MEKAKPITPDEEQIAAWKKEFGDIYMVEVDDKRAYLKKPPRKVLSYASTVATTDPMKFNELILQECMIGGDPEILSNDDLFLAVSAQLGELIKIKEATLVKL